MSTRTPTQLTAPCLISTAPSSNCHSMLDRCRLFPINWELRWALIKGCSNLKVRWVLTKGCSCRAEPRIADILSTTYTFSQEPVLMRKLFKASCKPSFVVKLSAMHGPYENWSMGSHLPSSMKPDHGGQVYATHSMHNQKTSRAQVTSRGKSHVRRSSPFMFHFQQVRYLKELATISIEFENLIMIQSHEVVIAPTTALPGTT